MVLRRIKDRVRERLGVIVNEVGEQDIWQRAELGCAVASGDRAKALRAARRRDRAVAIGAGGAEIVAIAKDVVDVRAPSRRRSRPVDDRTGAGDKADRGDDDWIPDAWRERDGASRARSRSRTRARSASRTAMREALTEAIARRRQGSARPRGDAADGRRSVEMNVDMAVANVYVSIVGDDATADGALDGLHEGRRLPARTDRPHGRPPARARAAVPRSTHRST